MTSNHSAPNAVLPVGLPKVPSSRQELPQSQHIASDLWAKALEQVTREGPWSTEIAAWVRSRN